MLHQERLLKLDFLTAAYLLSLFALSYKSYGFAGVSVE